MIKTIKSAVLRMIGRRPVVDQWEAVDARFNAGMALIQDGWKPWLSPLGPRPWDFQVIEVRRLDTSAMVTSHAFLPKEVNGSGLYWRPWRGVTVPGEFVTLDNVRTLVKR